MHFSVFPPQIFPSWIRIRILNADPDSGGKMNADPDPQPCLQVWAWAANFYDAMRLTVKVLYRRGAATWLKLCSILRAEVETVPTGGARCATGPGRELILRLWKPRYPISLMYIRLNKCSGAGGTEIIWDLAKAGADFFYRVPEPTFKPFNDEKRKVRRFSRNFYSLFLVVRWVQNFSNFWVISICSKVMQNISFSGFFNSASVPKKVACVAL